MAYSTLSTDSVQVSASSKMESSQRLRESVARSPASSDHDSLACFLASWMSLGSSSSSSANAIFVIIAT